MSQPELNEQVESECLNVDKYLSVMVNRSPNERRHKKGIFSRQFSTCRDASTVTSSNVDKMPKRSLDNSCEEQVS